MSIKNINFENTITKILILICSCYNNNFKIQILNQTEKNPIKNKIKFKVLIQHQNFRSYSYNSDLNWKH